MTVIKQYGKSKVEYLCTKDVVALNLNVVIPKLQFSATALSRIVEDFAKDYSKVEFCGLADLCYRLGIQYSSDACLDLIIMLKRFFKRYYPFMYFVQNGFEFDGSYGMLPLANLYKIDRIKDLVYVHKILVDQMTILGFASVQINEVLNTIDNLNALLPPDLVAKLPIMNEKNVIAFNKMCEVLEC